MSIITAANRERLGSDSPLQRNGGFTLFEIIIGITLFVSLSAVVVPTVVNQVRKGNISALVTELDGITAAVNSFYTDVARYPSEYNQLVSYPGTGAANEDNLTSVDQYAFWNDNSGFRKAFPSGRIKRWDGPYVATGYAPVATAAIDGLRTDFDGRLLRDFVMVCATGSRYLAVAVNGITLEDARAISVYKEQDEALGQFQLWDDVNDEWDTVGPIDAGDAGLVRWWDSSVGGDVDPLIGDLVFLVVAVGAPGC